MSKSLFQLYTEKGLLANASGALLYVIKEGEDEVVELGAGNGIALLDADGYLPAGNLRFNFGSSFADTDVDLHKHIALYSNDVGFNAIEGPGFFGDGYLSYHVPGGWAHRFYYGASVQLTVDASGAAVVGNLSATGTVIGSNLSGNNTGDQDLSDFPVLGVDGKIPTSYLPSAIIGQVEYQGLWDATSGAAPSLAPEKGDYYIVSVDGTTSVSGINEWKLGDWIIYNGAAWNKVDNTDAVSSVAGLIGIISAAALKAALTLVKGDVGLGNVDNTSDVNKPVSTAQQTALDAKQPVVPRVQSLASSATITATAADDLVKVTALAAAAQIANPTGAWSEGQGIAYRIKDNGTARALTYGSKMRAMAVTLPTTTVVGKTLYLGAIYNATDDKFDVTSVAPET